MARTRTGARAPWDQTRFWCGKLWICPNEMVPLQIDLAMGSRRYLSRPGGQPCGHQ